MNISTLIVELEAVREKHGDLEVGIFNQEWSCYDALSTIEFRTHNHADWEFSRDDDSLGEAFVGVW